MYAFEQDVPIDAAVYAQIKDAIGPELAPGFVLHVAIEREDGHLHYLDVWQTKEDCDRFTEERLHPAVGPALHAAGIQVDREPARREVNVIDLWRGAEVAAGRGLACGQYPTPVGPEHASTPNRDWPRAIDWQWLRADRVYPMLSITAAAYAFHPNRASVNQCVLSVTEPLSAER